MLSTLWTTVLSCFRLWLAGEETMCLDYVNERITTPVALIQSGWKVFHGSGNKLHFQVQSFKGSNAVIFDKWLVAEGTTATGSEHLRGGAYPAGFHIYEDETEVKGKSVRRVYYRNVLVRGTQYEKLVVAKEMYVPSDPDGWPPL